MRIVLLRDVKGVGRAHEEVAAADGYALNYLIPKKLAIPATISAIKEASLRRKQSEDRHALDATLLKQHIAVLSDAQVVVRTKANEKGILYDAVGESEIRTAIKEQVRVDLPEGVIKLEKPIKELGTFAIPLASHEIFGSFPLVVEAE